MPWDFDDIRRLRPCFPRSHVRLASFNVSIGCSHGCREVRPHRLRGKKRRSWIRRWKDDAGCVGPAGRLRHKPDFRVPPWRISASARDYPAWRHLNPSRRSSVTRNRPRRNDPHRHQKAGTHRRHRPQHHRQPQRTKPAAKPQGRRQGWEYLHLAIDDHSRLAYSKVFPDEKRKSCTRLLFNALRFSRSHGVKVYRVMTDNGTSDIPSLQKSAPNAGHHA